MADLLSILASSDPQAAQLLAASQGQQLQNAAIDPNFGHNEGLFGALAKTLAGFRGGGMVNDALPQIIAARQASLPEQASIYAQQDPLKALAAGNYSPTTMASVLSGVNPENASKARLFGNQAALSGQNVAGNQGVRDLISLGGTPEIGPVRGKSAGAITGAGAAPSAVPQDYNPRPQSSDASGTDSVASIIQKLPADPAQRGAALQKYDAATIAKIKNEVIRRINMQRGQTAGASPMKPPA